MAPPNLLFCRLPSKSTHAHAHAHRGHSSSTCTQPRDVAKPLALHDRRHSTHAACSDQAPARSLSGAEPPSAGGRLVRRPRSRPGAHVRPPLLHAARSSRLALLAVHTAPLPPLAHPLSASRRIPPSLAHVNARKINTKMRMSRAAECEWQVGGARESGGLVRCLYSRWERRGKISGAPCCSPYRLQYGTKPALCTRRTQQRRPARPPRADAVTAAYRSGRRP